MLADWDECVKKISTFGLNENSFILDVGSKDGKKTHYIFNSGFFKKNQIIMTDLCKKNLSPFVLADATFLPFKDNSFDLVTMLHVLEHIKNDIGALNEIYRVLKKDGHTLLVTPNGQRFTRLYSLFIKIIKRSPYKYPLNPDHVIEYSGSEIENTMKSSVLQNYKIEPIFMRISRYLRIKRHCDQWIITAKK